jgi:hypothetical protein
MNGLMCDLVPPGCYCSVNVNAQACFKRRWPKEDACKLFYICLSRCFVPFQPFPMRSHVALRIPHYFSTSSEAPLALGRAAALMPVQGSVVQVNFQSPSAGFWVERSIKDGLFFLRFKPTNRHILGFVSWDLPIAILEHSTVMFIGYPQPCILVAYELIPRNLFPAFANRGPRWSSAAQHLERLALGVHRGTAKQTSTRLQYQPLILEHGGTNIDWKPFTMQFGDLQIVSSPVPFI